GTVLLALVDVLQELALEHVALERNLRPGEVALLPGRNRIDERARRARQHEGHQDRRAHGWDSGVRRPGRPAHRAPSDSRIFASSSARSASRKPACWTRTLPSGPNRNEVGIPLIA